MKRKYFVYNDGRKVIHKSAVKDSTMFREAKNATIVMIYKCNEYELEQQIDEDLSSGKYLTSLLLK